MADHDDVDDSQFPDNDEFVPYVIGSSLGVRNGFKVVCWGLITKVSASEGFYIKTVDDQEVLIKVKKPLSEALEGWYEIHGVCQGRSIMCDDYLPLPLETSKSIDLEGHKGLCKLLSALDDPWSLGEDGTINGGIDGVVPME